MASNQGTFNYENSNTGIFTDPGIGAPFLQFSETPGATGWRFYMIGSDLWVRDSSNVSSLFVFGGGPTGPQGAMGFRGYQGPIGPTGPAGGGGGGSGATGATGLNHRLPIERKAEA